jgi:hypothetical protein
LATFLRYVRRTKPPSLREQALAAQLSECGMEHRQNHDDWNLIRRALEALDDPLQSLTTAPSPATLSKCLYGITPKVSMLT